MNEEPAPAIDTVSHWEARYRAGGTSGAGSYGHLARYKAGFLNRFVVDNRVDSVAELGCGDGAQLELARYPRYVGYDVSAAAVERCQQLFAGDVTKQFIDLAHALILEPADVGLSLDVVYCLLDEEIYQAHLANLFRIAQRFAIIYGNGCVRPYSASHVLLRDFNATIRVRFPDWTLVDAQRNPFYSEVGTDPNATWSNFYVYEPRRRVRHSIAAPIPAASHGASTTGLTVPADIAELLAQSGRVIAIEPWNSPVMAAALRQRRVPSAIAVGLAGGDEAPGFAADLVGTYGQRYRKASLTTLAHAPANDPGAQLILLSVEALERLTTADLRAIVRIAAEGAVIVAEASTARAEAGLARAIAGSYLREILPELQGRMAGRGMWTGAVRKLPAIVVSLTTIAARVGLVGRVIHAILAQSRLPDRIVLNVSEEPHLLDTGIKVDALPEDLRRMEASGLLEIRVVRNTGPYRKLLPVLRQEWESNCIIVTADDDILYPHFWLDELLRAYLQAPAVSAFRCSTMRMDGTRPRRYAEWPLSTENDQVRPEWRNLFVFATGRDGILYHPSFFTEDVFDPKLITLAPTADDLTFKLMTMITETPVVPVARLLSGVGLHPEFPAVADDLQGLWSVNATGHNDESLSRLLDYLAIDDKLHLQRFMNVP